MKNALLILDWFGELPLGFYLIPSNIFELHKESFLKSNECAINMDNTSDVDDALDLIFGLVCPYDSEGNQGEPLEGIRKILPLNVNNSIEFDSIYTIGFAP